MNSIKLKPFLYMVVITSIIVAFFKIPVDKPILFKTIIGFIETDVSVLLILGIFFVRYLWKLPLFRGWLVPFPDLTGTWKGEIQTTWEDPITHSRPGPIPVVLSIKQTFLSTHCVMMTSEMKSSSITSNLMIKTDEQIKTLSYIYLSIPKQTVKERSPYHFGAINFEIIEKPELKLEGNYWTDRQTTGTITLQFSKRELTENYPNNSEPHPVSHVRNNQS